MLEFVNDFKVSFYEQYVNLSTLKDDYKSHLMSKNSMVNRISKSINANIKGLKDSKSTTAVVKNSSMVKKKLIDKNLTPSKSEKVIVNENKSFKKQPLKKEINLESDDKNSNLNKTLPSKTKKFNEFNKNKDENITKNKEDIASDSKGMKVYKLNTTMKEKSNMKLHDKEIKQKNAKESKELKESKETKETKETKDDKKQTESKIVKNPKFVPKTPTTKKVKTDENEVDKSDTKSSKNNNSKNIPKSGIKPNLNNKKEINVKVPQQKQEAKTNDQSVNCDNIIKTVSNTVEIKVDSNNEDKGENNEIKIDNSNLLNSNEEITTSKVNGKSFYY